jgi:hypothetical protein
MLILKNNFLKIKKYYFNTFVNKNHFEKQQQLDSHARFKELSFKLYKLT